METGAENIFMSYHALISGSFTNEVEIMKLKLKIEHKFFILFHRKKNMFSFLQ